MDVIPKIEILMSEYGGPKDDIIEMGKPGVRALVNLKNQTGHVVRDQGENPADVGDIELLMLISYIKKAPFAKTPAAFLDYCDKLDDEGAALFEKMSEVVADLGGYSVFRN